MLFFNIYLFLSLSFALLIFPPHFSHTLAPLIVLSSLFVLSLFNFIFVPLLFFSSQAPFVFLFFFFFCLFQSFIVVPLKLIQTQTPLLAKAMLSRKWLGAVSSPLFLSPLVRFHSSPLAHLLSNSTETHAVFSMCPLKQMAFTDTPPHNDSKWNFFFPLCHKSEDALSHVSPSASSC